MEKATVFNAMSVGCGTRRLWLVCKAEADNLIGHNPNEQRRNHSAQPDGSRESRPDPTKEPLAVDIIGRPSDDSDNMRPDFCGRRIRFDDCGATAAGELRDAWSHRGRVPSNLTEPPATALAHSDTDLSSSRHGHGGSACSALLSTPKHSNRNFGPDRDRDREPNAYRDCHTDGNGNRHIYTIPESNFITYSLFNSDSLSYSDCNSDSNPDPYSHRYPNRKRSNPTAHIDLHCNQRTVADIYMDFLPGAERDDRPKLQPIREQRL